MREEPRGVPHRSDPELRAGLEFIRSSPQDGGRLVAIVVRPETNAREELPSCHLAPGHGACGDRWVRRFPAPPLPGMPEQDSEITLMNSRVAALVAGTRDRWALAGDQLFVDFDLAADNLPPGQRLRIGSAVLEIVALPHKGCRKFAARFGEAALAFVNAPAGLRLHLRGVYARILHPGQVHVGDRIDKVPASD
jgi:hypothetical protein